MYMRTSSRCREQFTSSTPLASTTQVEATPRCSARYSKDVPLHGIIYLHRITDVRMQGSAKKNLLMFKKLCGDDALRKVVLATTMWDKVPVHEAKERESQLVTTPEFWGFMISKGSTVYRHNNSVESAIRIIEKLACDNSTVTLDLQSQMVDRNQNLSETAAGRELESELIKERQKIAAEIKDAQEQMKEAMRLRDKEAEQALRELKEDYTTRMTRLERDNQQLRIDTARLREEQIERLEKALEAQSKAHAEELGNLQEMKVRIKKANESIGKKKVNTNNSLPCISPSVIAPMSASRNTSSNTSRNSQSFSLSLYRNLWTLNGPLNSWQYVLIYFDNLKVG